jgi:hypothetical protein
MRWLLASGFCGRHARMRPQRKSSSPTR